jgi:hypothetical protein
LYLLSHSPPPSNRFAQATEESRVHKFILCTATNSRTPDLPFMTRFGIPAKDVKCVTKGDGRTLALVQLAAKMRRSDIMRQLNAGAGASDMEVLVASGTTKEEYERVLKETFTATKTRETPHDQKKRKTDKKRDKRRDDSTDDEDDEDHDDEDKADEEQMKDVLPPPSARVVALQEEVVMLRERIAVFLPVLPGQRFARFLDCETMAAGNKGQLAAYDALVAKHETHVERLATFGVSCMSFTEHCGEKSDTHKRIAELEKRKKAQEAELALMTVRRDNLQKRRDDAARKKARGW